MLEQCKIVTCTVFVIPFVKRIDTTILTHFLYLFFSAVKAKNVVTLSVDDIFAQPGIGVPGVSSTDTSHGLFIGGMQGFLYLNAMINTININTICNIFSGHPRTDRLTGLQTSANYVGCIKNIVIENVPLQVEPEMLRGDIMSHVCPTI